MLNVSYINVNLYISKRHVHHTLQYQPQNHNYNDTLYYVYLSNACVEE